MMLQIIPVDALQGPTNGRLTADGNGRPAASTPEALAVVRTQVMNPVTYRDLGDPLIEYSGQGQP